MIEIELAYEKPWPDLDWTALADRASRAAIARTPHAELLASDSPFEISMRLTTDEEVHALNRQYRHKDKPTNVLSFPMIEPELIDNATQRPGDSEVLLGDIVLAHGVCAAEAAKRGIALETHATHLIVHGTLHLLGYDHIDEREAEAMEAIEIDALGRLGIADPYLIDED